MGLRASLGAPASKLPRRLQSRIQLRACAPKHSQPPPHNCFDSHRWLDFSQAKKALIVKTTPAMYMQLAELNRYVKAMHSARHNPPALTYATNLALRAENRLRDMMKSPVWMLDVILMRLESALHGGDKTAISNRMQATACELRFIKTLMDAARPAVPA